MALRLILAVFPERLAETLEEAAKKCEPLDLKITRGGNNGAATAEILVSADRSQQIIDDVQSALEGEEGWRINIVTVDATVPKLSEEELERQRSNQTSTAREEIYEDVSVGATLDMRFLVLTAISAVVATIGLNEDSVAVVIGAMVIAPLLGPNLAFSLGVALGDTGLMRRAAVTTAAGIGASFVLATILGLVLPVNLESEELLQRAEIGFADPVLALASGAAAALSVTSGLATTLVGVMVAVALLPPAAAAGLLLGGGQEAAAIAALILLLTNVVCINLSAQIVFILQGVRPRQWLERQAAEHAIRTNLIVLGGLIVALVAVIYLWTRVFDIQIDLTAG